MTRRRLFADLARHSPNLRQSTLQELQGSRRCAIARFGGAFSSFDRAVNLAKI
jgi:hypothetical protein